MKYLFPAILVLSVAGCSSPATKTEAAANPQQAAVEAYMRKTLDDPASYQPGRFSGVVPFSRADSANLAALDLMKSAMPAQRKLGYTLVDGPGKDSTTIVGNRLVHTYRAKNKMGALVLDSAAFVVYKNGTVHYNY